MLLGCANDRDQCDCQTSGPKPAHPARPDRRGGRSRRRCHVRRRSRRERTGHRPAAPRSDVVRRSTQGPVRAECRVSRGRTYGVGATVTSTLESSIAAGATLLLDTSAVLAYLSGSEAASRAAASVVDGFVGGGRNPGVVSAITVTEALVRPMRAGSTAA